MENSQMVDKMTTSSDKPVPQGMTEAEFTEQQRKEAEKAAVTREDAAQRIDSTNRDNSTTRSQRSPSERLQDPHTAQEQQAQPAETIAQGSQTEQSRREHLQTSQQQSRNVGDTRQATNVERAADVERRAEAQQSSVRSDFHDGMAHITEPLIAMKHHLDALALLARDLPNSNELAVFTTSIMAALRQLEDMKTVEP